MAQLQIKFDQDACQSNFVCTAVDPDHFQEADNGKAEMPGGEWDGSIQTLEIDDDEREKAVRAAEGCPMMAIEIIDQTTGETEAP